MIHLRPVRPDELALLRLIDDDASILYAAAGLPLALAEDHPFLLGEMTRWGRAILCDAAFMAVDEQNHALGFVALGTTDGEPYLEQVSVRTRAMRRGVGRALLARAVDWAKARKARNLWLTTYAHLPWNAPWYSRCGFEPVPEQECGADVRAHLAEQREALPEPLLRIAMRKSLA
jgi:GNAT superfamily N-acetyltransferase